MPREYLSVHTLGDTLVRYPHDPVTGRVGLELLPASLVGEALAPRDSLRGEAFIDVLPGDDPWPARPVESLLQFKLVGDPYPGAFAQGHTMRNSGTLHRFKLAGQQVITEGDATVIETRIASEDGLVAAHRLRWKEGDGAFGVSSSFTNGSNKPVALEMLASFSLAGISPFHVADAPGRLKVHRFRSVWSAEGRHECRGIEELHLERSWSGASAFSERFGQLGTMPVRRWFPFVAVEDTVPGVLWGAQLAWAGSWQMEIFRQHDDVSISGGLADREFGHWMKTLQPGESLEGPPATIACVQGGLDDLCDRLTAMQDAAVNLQPQVEQDLPVVFNEWCTTWGDPSHEKLCAIADRLKDSGVRYFVIDAGWYKAADTDWSSGHGDWNPSETLFPSGLRAAADAIRERGLIPGLWFEMETVGSQSVAFKLGKHFITRDGIPVTVRERRFWDLNDPAAIDYLTGKVIDLLESCGFGYLKVDYNETAGLGCDHPDSQGEGLRRQIKGTYRFFDRIRERLPELVIENCASGGHRLEPSMLARTAMSSFSDAHELVEIPLIAANLHHLLLPRQNQIWAVLHPHDSLQRIRYSLAATFLGRMCLSGGIAGLPAESWQLVREMIGLYAEAAPVIKYGTSRRFGEIGESWRHPQGWQAVVRTSESQVLVVLHAFAGAPAEVMVPLEGGWEMREGFGSGSARLVDGGMVVELAGDFSAGVWLLGK
ncbi:alpha-galactosidase [Luteolibacter arcticus]|uniref:Alpha-galactosidase n=1 Tax=Luteolibacter arcticus TaxID=1581411 RepID=A0ABT3GQM5_9BACT|nr:glycoside hydrolase family 36 protein [Luteolibacter arcticus]MCW1925792.1 alpha-galactosidase [Luteolibacter arcticus]